MLEPVRKLFHMNFTLYGSSGTADFYSEHGIPVTSVSWPFNENGKVLLGSLLRFNLLHKLSSEMILDIFWAVCWRHLLKLKLKLFFELKLW